MAHVSLVKICFSLTVWSCEAWCSLLSRWVQFVLLKEANGCLGQTLLLTCITSISIIIVTDSCCFRIEATIKSTTHSLFLFDIKLCVNSSLCSSFWARWSVIESLESIRAWASTFNRGRWQAFDATLLLTIKLVVLFNGCGRWPIQVAGHILLPRITLSLKSCVHNRCSFWSSKSLFKLTILWAVIIL